MSRSLRTDPYPLRAARRAPTAVPVRVCPPRPGFVHPAGPGDIARILDFFAPAAVYGLRGVELRQRPATVAGPAVAALRVPGLVLLFEQPEPPWLLPGRLTAAATARLERAGARVTAGAQVMAGARVAAVAQVAAGTRIAAGARVDWPGDTLRDFMLFDGLMHEIGHHAVQHAAHRHRTRAMRTADHERRADAHALAARLAWAARW